MIVKIFIKRVKKNTKENINESDDWEWADDINPIIHPITNNGIYGLIGHQFRYWTGRVVNGDTWTITNYDGELVTYEGSNLTGVSGDYPVDDFLHFINRPIEHGRPSWLLMDPVTGKVYDWYHQNDINIRESKDDLDWVRDTVTDITEFFIPGEKYYMDRLVGNKKTDNTFTFTGYNTSWSSSDEYEDGRGMFEFGGFNYSPLFIEQHLMVRGLVLTDLLVDTSLNESGDFDWANDFSNSNVDLMDVLIDIRDNLPTNLENRWHDRTEQIERIIIRLKEIEKLTCSDEWNLTCSITGNLLFMFKGIETFINRGVSNSKSRWDKRSIPRRLNRIKRNSKLYIKELAKDSGIDINESDDLDWMRNIDVTVGDICENDAKEYIKVGDTLLLTGDLYLDTGAKNSIIKLIDEPVKILSVERKDFRVVFSEEIRSNDIWVNHISDVYLDLGAIDEDDQLIVKFKPNNVNESDNIFERNSDEDYYQHPAGLSSNTPIDNDNLEVSPSKRTIKNVCDSEKFCTEQGSITFGQLKAIVESATKKRFFINVGEGGYKATIRLLPWFLPQLAISGFIGSSVRALNKLLKPTITDTGTYKTWWGRVTMRIFSLAEGEINTTDPLSRVFFISDGLMTMLSSEYKIKFAKYISELASIKPDNEIVPDYFVENELRKWVNDKFLLDPPLTMNESVFDGYGINESDDFDWVQSRLINPWELGYTGIHFDILPAKEDIHSLVEMLISTGNVRNPSGWLGEFNVSTLITYQRAGGAYLAFDDFRSLTYGSEPYYDGWENIKWVKYSQLINKPMNESDDLGWMDDVVTNPFMLYDIIVFDVEPPEEDIKKYIGLALDSRDPIGNIDSWPGGWDDSDLDAILDTQHNHGLSMLGFNDDYLVRGGLTFDPETTSKKIIRYSELIKK